MKSISIISFIALLCCVKQSIALGTFSFGKCDTYSILKPWIFQCFSCGASFGKIEGKQSLNQGLCLL